MDNRSTLKPGTELKLWEVNGKSENKYQFRIIEVVGKGANCITYNAIRYGSYGTEHLVRLKECYPCFECRIKRDEQNGLVVLNGVEGWLERKQQFEEAYKNNVMLQRELGLVNSSANVNSLLEGNHTLYMVIEYDEGVDYEQIQNETVRDTFRVARAVARVLEKYHRKGYLYLDLKPANILILPETKELIKLLDFDSVISKKQLLMDEQITLGGTKGFSAPEQLRMMIDQISECADVYSIGAIVFQKLMGRVAETADGKYHAEYDFEQIKRRNENLQLEFFRELEDFFKRTLSISIENRYQSMEEVRSKLEKLISLSDEREKFIFDNFVYHQAVFVGREQEIEEIGNCFKKNVLLFLHGIGGIGKSEIARQYAYRRRDDYRIILFVNFQNSILETVCGEEIRIANTEREEKETERNYFDRKLRLMKDYLRQDDLLILDNFDVEWDTDLEEFLKCRCQFLITSREDYSDYNFRQIEIKEMKRSEELSELFYSYQREADWYQEKEQKAVKSLIEWADYHTMTIELIAKYLRISGISPCTYLKRLTTVEGIINSGEEEVKHKKDNRMTKTSVEKHLQAVFDLSGMEEQGKLVLRSLSLFGNTRIQRELFLCWCQEADVQVVERLSDSGWLIYDRETGKISLHQIILDLVYANLKPDSENCTSVTEAMIALLNQEWKSRIERENKKRLLKIVAKRIHGKDERLVRFYLAYCKRVKNEKEYLNFCISFCQKQGMRRELSEAYVCLGELLWEELRSQGMLEEEEQLRKAEEIAEIFKKAVDAWEEDSFLIVERIEKLLDESEFFYLEDSVRQVFRILIECFLPKLSFDGFFNEEKSENVKEKESSLEEFYYYEKGALAEWMGNYKEAIQFYQRELILYKDEWMLVLPALARAYEKAGDWQKAVECYEKVGKQKEGLSISRGDTDLQIARLYRENGRPENAMKYCEKRGSQKAEDEEALLIGTYYERYRISGEKADWEQAVGLYEEQEEAIKGDRVILPFLIAYAKEWMEKGWMKKAMCLWEQAGKIHIEYMEFVEAEQCYQKMYQAAKEITEKAGMIRALFGSSKAKLGEWEGCPDKEIWQQAWNFCEQAWEIAKEEDKGFLVEKMRLLDWFGELCDVVSDYEKGDAYRDKCDYFLIADEDSRGKVGREADKVWFQAAKNYLDRKRTEEAIRCLEKITEPFFPEKVDWMEETDVIAEEYVDRKKIEVEVLLEMGKKKEAGSYLVQITKILWKIYELSPQKGSICRIAWKLEEMSRLYERYGDREYALKLELLCGILRLHEKEREEGIERKDIWKVGKELYDSLIKKKNAGELQGKLLDDLLRIGERVLAVAGEDGKFGVIGRQFGELVRCWREEEFVF